MAWGWESAFYTQPFVPFNKARANTVTIDKWQQSLSRSVPVAKAKPSQATTFAVPAQASNIVILRSWYQPLGKAPATSRAKPTQATSFSVPAQTHTNAGPTIKSIPLYYDAGIHRKLTVYYQAKIAPPAR